VNKKPEPENGIKYFPWPAALTQPGERAYFKIAKLDRPEYQEALARAYRKHGVRASNPNRLRRSGKMIATEPAFKNVEIIKFLNHGFVNRLALNAAV
jgi:hypothetical protein